MRRIIVCALLAAVSTTLNASAQPNDPENFIGARITPQSQTQPASTTSLPAGAGISYRIYMPLRFETLSSNTQFAYQLGGRYVTAGTPGFGLQLEVPQGAQVQEITLFYVDNAAGAIEMTVYEQAPNETTTALIGAASTAGADSANIRSLSLTGSPITTADNAQRTLYVEVTLPSTTANHRLHGLRVGYRYNSTFLPLLKRE